MPSGSESEAESPFLTNKIAYAELQTIKPKQSKLRTSSRWVTAPKLKALGRDEVFARLLEKKAQILGLRAWGLEKGMQGLGT